MHHALEVQEIFSNIFGHCNWRGEETGSVALARLARTCRAFKDPALDVLWDVLDSLCPLTEYVLPASPAQTPDDSEHLLERALTASEWDNIRSYTRRIRFVRDFRMGLNKKSSKILTNPSTTEPLFPNLRSLFCEYRTEPMHLLDIPFPSLTSLEVELQQPRWFQDSLASLPESSPHIRTVSLSVEETDVSFSKLVSSCICRWRNLQVVKCYDIPLGMNALVHLSQVPGLTVLSFFVDPTLPKPDSPLFFPSLRRFVVCFASWEATSRLLSWTRLPVVTVFGTVTDSRPSGRELTSFFAALQTSGAGATIEDLSIYHPFVDVLRMEDLILGLNNLQICKAFSNLRSIYIDIPWNVGLTDNDLLALASAWPYLEEFMINASWGWNTQGGITPSGLLGLLQKCPSLNRIALAMDVRGYTESPPSGTFASLKLKSPDYLFLNAVDSIIEAESVPAIAAFFTGFGYDLLEVYAWGDQGLVTSPDWVVYRERWLDVERRVADAANGHA